MKVEIYQRKNGPMGVYVSGDLTGPLPFTVFYRTLAGKVTEIPLPAGYEQAIKMICACSLYPEQIEPRCAACGELRTNHSKLCNTNEAKFYRGEN